MTKDEIIAALKPFPGDYTIRLDHPEFMNEDLVVVGVSVNRKYGQIFLDYECGTKSKYEQADDKKGGE
jgi:hypothetical protein